VGGAGRAASGEAHEQAPRDADAKMGGGGGQAHAGFSNQGEAKGGAGAGGGAEAQGKVGDDKNNAQGGAAVAGPARSPAKAKHSRRAISTSSRPEGITRRALSTTAARSMPRRRVASARPSLGAVGQGRRQRGRNMAGGMPRRSRQRQRQVSGKLHAEQSVDVNQPRRKREPQREPQQLQLGSAKVDGDVDAGPAAVCPR